MRATVGRDGVVVNRSLRTPDLYPLVAGLDNRLRHAPGLPYLGGPSEPVDDERCVGLDRLSARRAEEPL